MLAIYAIIRYVRLEYIDFIGPGSEETSQRPIMQ